MSKHELFEAYIVRTINRRTFVQGLTALGVSAGVAASYAVALQPAAAGGRRLHDDLYHDYYCDDPHDDFYYDNPGADTSPTTPFSYSSGGSGKLRQRGKKKGKAKGKGKKKGN